MDHRVIGQREAGRVFVKPRETRHLAADAFEASPRRTNSWVSALAAEHRDQFVALDADRGGLLIHLRASSSAARRCFTSLANHCIAADR